MTRQTQTTIILEQLRKGNMGAGGYFTKRIELLLRDGDAFRLESFMRSFWPAFKEGYDCLQRQKLETRVVGE